MDVDIVDLEYLDVEPPTLDAGTPDVTIWSDGADGPVAFGATRGDWHWLRFVGVGTYRFPVRPSGLTIAAGVVPEPSVDHALLVDSYYRSIVPLALQAYGLEALHGSAVALPGGVVAMCADRETGKSTIAFALQRRGHAVVADDSVVLSVPVTDDDGPVTVHPLPFELRLRRPTADHFHVPDRHHVAVDGTSTRTRSDDLSLSAIVLLSRDDHVGSVHLTRLPANQAFSSVLSQSHAFSLAHGERKREMMRGYLRLVDSVPVYRLTYPTGLEYLDAICERIETVAERGATMDGGPV